jgi:hypothetical protein
LHCCPFPGAAVQLPHQPRLLAVQGSISGMGESIRVSASSGTLFQVSRLQFESLASTESTPRVCAFVISLSSCCRLRLLSYDTSRCQRRKSCVVRVGPRAQPRRPSAAAAENLSAAGQPATGRVGNRQAWNRTTACGDFERPCHVSPAWRPRPVSIPAVVSVPG